MITLILTESYWKTADLADLEREIIEKVANVPLGEFDRCHPEVRWAIGRDDFFDYFKIRIHAVRNGNRYHLPETGWTQLKRSRVARTPERILEIDWSPVKIRDTPIRAALFSTGSSPARFGQRKER